MSLDAWNALTFPEKIDIFDQFYRVRWERQLYAGTITTDRLLHYHSHGEWLWP